MLQTYELNKKDTHGMAPSQLVDINILFKSLIFFEMLSFSFSRNM